MATQPTDLLVGWIPTTEGDCCCCPIYTSWSNRPQKLPKLYYLDIKPWVGGYIYIYTRNISSKCCCCCCCCCCCRRRRRFTEFHHWHFFSRKPWPKPSWPGLWACLDRSASTNQKQEHDLLGYDDWGWLGYDYWEMMTGVWWLGMMTGVWWLCWCNCWSSSMTNVTGKATIHLTGAFYVGNGWEWGLLGWLYTSDDMDHSRKFPTKHQ